MKSANDWLHEPPEEVSSIRVPHRLETRDILRAMITKEVQSGRATSQRRRRIVQFASQLGLSPIEAGELVQACCVDANESGSSVGESNELGKIPEFNLGFSKAASYDRRPYVWRQLAYLAIAAGLSMIIVFVFVLVSSS